jgi:hypothetical protein
LLSQSTTLVLRVLNYLNRFPIFVAKANVIVIHVLHVFSMMQMNAPHYEPG